MNQTLRCKSNLSPGWQWCASPEATIEASAEATIEATHRPQPPPKTGPPPPPPASTPIWPSFLPWQKSSVILFHLTPCDMLVWQKCHSVWQTVSQFDWEDLAWQANGQKDRCANLCNRITWRIRVSSCFPVFVRVFAANKQTNTGFHHWVGSSDSRIKFRIQSNLPRKILEFSISPHRNPTQYKSPPNPLPNFARFFKIERKHAISLFCSWTLQLRTGNDALSFELHTVPLLIHNLNAHYLLINVCEKNQQKFLQLS